MALLMSCFMSLVRTIFNMGVVGGLLKIWLKARSFAFVVAFPTVVVVAPLVRKIVSKIVDDGLYGN